jgi:hypothetical protein
LGSTNGLSTSSKWFPIALIDSTLADFRIPIGVFVIMFLRISASFQKTAIAVLAEL